MIVIRKDSVWKSLVLLYELDFNARNTEVGKTNKKLILHNGKAQFKKKLFWHGCPIGRVIGTILVDIQISLLPTPGRIFPIRWAHSWALRQNHINNAKYESTIKLSNKKYRATCKDLLVGRRNFSVNTGTAERTIEVDAFKVTTKIDCWSLMQINK